MVSIAGLNKADLLATLYNRAKPQGLGFLHATPEDMTKEQAQALLDSGQYYFDYVQGRVMKIYLENDNMRTDLYKRDNGQDAAEEIINKLRIK